MFSTKIFLLVLVFLEFVTAEPFSPHGSRMLRRHGAHNPLSLRRRRTRCAAGPPPTNTAATTEQDSPTSTAGGESSSPTTRSSSTTTTKKAATETSSSSGPEPTSGGGGSGGGSSGKAGILSSLLPITVKGDSSWTTSPQSDDHLPLSDSTFQPEKVLKSLTHAYTAAPDGKKAMKAHYPEGSYNFQHEPLGGFSFYAPGPDSLDLTDAKEATFGYSVFFPKGFAFQKGGKLPGLYGGNSEEEATGCSGGRRDTGCFSARLMWRTDGAGEFYTYFPDPSVPGFSVNSKLCNVKPESECNPTYGASVGRGAFEFATGKWTTVAERVRLNDVGEANGEIELFVNGESVISVKGVIIRDSDKGKIRGMQMQTFFGGSTDDFASPKDQDVYFSDFSVAIIEKF